LVTQLGKAAGLGSRPVPVLVVPGALSREDIRALAFSAGLTGVATTTT